ncbi:hypothetical protein DRB17_05550 [Ferruginivarius sediminum]|uniref:Uncharacterized protein n=2 Tax=Ferruginivarius sediminum TaxID=2661937 RepID=A0A369TIB7_9PROT|nr:hypothetical protein DRB17_05550 [Ferruginivarius sediminum]
MGVADSESYEAGFMDALNEMIARGRCPLSDGSNRKARRPIAIYLRDRVGEHYGGGTSLHSAARAFASSLKRKDELRIWKTLAQMSADDVRNVQNWMQEGSARVTEFCERMTALANAIEGKVNGHTSSRH